MKLKRIGTLMLALILCVGMLPLSAMAEGTSTLPEIVYWEDFSQAQATGVINTSGSDRTIATQNGIFLCKSAEAVYSFDNGTLNYTVKPYSDYIDLRFSRGSVMEKDLMQDFVLSFKIKPDTDAFSAGFHFSGRYEHSATVSTNYNGFAIKEGKLYAGSTLVSDTAVLPANQWSLVEIAYHYNETIMPENPALGAGAIDSYTIMLNGEAIYTANLTYYVKSYDFFRMFRYSTGNFELDDLRVALGSQSLKVFDDNGGVKADSYAQNFSWFDVNENAMENYAYSFAIVGDTQILNMDDYMSRTPGSKLYDTYDAPTNYMATLYDWIVANSDSKNIAHVFGLGDITDDNTNLEWEIAKEQIGKLDGVVPYSLVRGNHDGSDKYNSAFAGNTAYTEQFEGFYTAGKLENSYKRFTVGNTKYLAITLDNGAKDDVLAWAGSIIERYPDHKVIITTHAYFSEDGDTLHSGDADTPSKNGEEYNDGNEMWDKLVSKYENIFLVMSGHIDADYLVCTQSLGENGNTVTQLLVDPQGLDEEVGSTSMVTMLYFSEDGETVSVETYSTVRNQYFAKENQFTFNVNAPCEDPNAIYFNDFESCTTADIPASVGGKTVLGAENCGHSVANGVLNISKTTDSGYVSLRLDQGNAAYKDAGATPIKGDVTLSFDIKIDNATAKIGALYYGNDAAGMSGAFMNVAQGKITGFGKDTALKIGEWNTVKTVFNYDSANNRYGSYTVILNGEELHTQKIAAGVNHASINRFVMFRWGDSNATFAVDNIGYSYGASIRGAGKATKIWGVDFEGVTELPTNAARLNNMRVMNNYLPTTNAAATSRVANGIMSLVNGGGQAFVDINPDSSFGYYGDMTFSMKIRATGTDWNGGTAINARYDSTNVDILKFGNQNQVRLNKTDAVVADFSLYRFTTIELMFHYDYATATYTSVSLCVDGVCVDSMALSGWSQIKWFRVLYCFTAGNGVDVDELSLTKSCQSTYRGETSVTEFIGYQTTAIENNAFNLRLLSVMTDRDLSKYECVGYNVTASFVKNGQTVTMVLPEELGKCNKVFTAVLATEDMAVESEITAATLGGEYIIALNCIGLPADCGDIEFTVSTYYKLNDADASVTERAFTFTVSPATNANQGGVN